MSRNTSSESFRISFSLRNEQQIREFQFLASLPSKDRQQFLHLAVSTLAQKINYTVPENGFMGILTALVNCPTQAAFPVQAPLPPIMGGDELLEKRKSARIAKAAAKPAKKPRDETSVNSSFEITEDETSEVSDAILASLALFDSDITDATQ